MAKISPERWLAARQQWEGSLEVSYTDIAAQLDVAIPTVSIRAKKELWTKAEVVDLERINYSPRQLTEIAMRTLVRAALQTKDHATAVKAAGMLLDRTMGRVVAEQTAPMLPPDIPNETEGWPNWLKERRLAYQEGRLGPLEGDPPPDPASTPAERPPAPPITQVEAARTIEPSPERAPIDAEENYTPFRPGLVEPPAPQFWDSPTRPSHSDPFSGRS